MRHNPDSRQVDPESFSRSPGRKIRRAIAYRAAEAHLNDPPPQSTKLILACLMTAGLAIGPAAGQFGAVVDEAKAIGRTAASFTHADEDYFHDMDNGVSLTPEEVRGRNMWNVWTGGNDRFWDGMVKSTFGAFDLLKIVTTHPSQRTTRDSRWEFLGVVNEPCFEKASGPDPDRFNLWLDRRRSDCSPDPFENEAKYPGVKTGARGKTLPVGSYYGYATGIVGLRLFPNPAFDAKAKARWDAERYYTDAIYYNDQNLVRPYRVGMTCGFCHVGPSPIHPPADPAHPKWEDLNSTVGAQYLWLDRVFIYAARPDNFMYQLMHTYRPGTMDTSLVSTDNINNPRTMNAIYNLSGRLDIARRWGQEQIVGGERNNKQFNDYVTSGPLTEFFKPPGTVLTPHILKDGTDAIGVLAALNRVYLNIGLFSEEWLRHFNAIVGGKPITPILIATVERNSSYWQATEAGTPDMARFLLKAGHPDYLRDAPGGEAYLTKNQAQLDRGADVFAETCARCHSSKQPPEPVSLDAAGCIGPNYLSCWSNFWEHTKTEAYKKQMRDLVHAPDFLDNNALTTDVRIPVTLLQTNACSPLATNSLANNIWDNFASHSYKSLPLVGSIIVHDPVTGEPRPYPIPAGGRGYTRPPSLVSLWSSAPFLLNNTVGPFSGDPSVESRMKLFQTSIEQMLWPERREKDPILGDKIPGFIDRTSERSWIYIPAGFQPKLLAPLRDIVRRRHPQLVDAKGNIKLGPIPAGTPINLLANLQILAESNDPRVFAAHVEKVIKLLVRMQGDLATLPLDASDAELRQKLSNLAGPLLELSKCPDFVINRGHYFGTALSGEEPGLSDSDKQALIAFLKTF
jgi:hypothetical protein